jgi:hypothetical protein
LLIPRRDDGQERQRSGKLLPEITDEDRVVQPGPARRHFLHRR